MLVLYTSGLLINAYKDTIGLRINNCCLIGPSPPGKLTVEEAVSSTQEGWQQHSNACPLRR